MSDTKGKGKDLEQWAADGEKLRKENKEKDDYIADTDPNSPKVKRMLKQIEKVEKDPDGKDAKTPGSKLDFGKLKLFEHFLSYFPLAIEAVCEVSTFGAQKYTTMGWAKVEKGRERYREALLRHMLAEAKGEVYDKDSKLRHAAQEAWNALATLELLIRKDK